MAMGLAKLEESSSAKAEARAIILRILPRTEAADRKLSRKMYPRGTCVSSVRRSLRRDRCVGLTA